MTDPTPEPEVSSVDQPIPDDGAKKVQSASRRPLILALSISGAVVVALAITVIMLLLPKSENAQACKDYATGYNGLADAVKVAHKDGSDAALVSAEQDNMQVMISRASLEAHGKVASAMIDSAALADGIGTNADAGTAFFLSTTTVKAACDSDGAGITLDPLD
jgi:hypothetical protein